MSTKADQGDRLVPPIETLPLTCTHWGTYRISSENGVPVSLLGFEDDPDPSPIGNAILETIHGPSRIRKPAIRKGWLEGNHDQGRDRRGNDSFVEVEWDLALDLVAAELERTRSTFGNESIFAGSYGWASAGRFHHAQSQLRRFMNMFGGSTNSTNSYSYASAEVILPHVVGAMSQLLIDHTSWKAVAQGAKLVVGFGGMARRNAQANAGGAGQHCQHQDMLAARDAGVEFVNVSPAKDDADQELEAHWLPIRPNTDMALMLGLAHTLVKENLHDEAFLERYCVGFDLFLPYLMGDVDGQPKDTKWAGKVTGIPSDEIEQLAHRMASVPTVLNVSWSLTRQQNGEQNYWMVIVLAAMLGDIGKVGCGFAVGLGTVNGVGSHRAHLPWAALPTGKNPVETFIPVARISDLLLNPGKSFQYNGRNLEYPDIRLVYWAGGNPFHHHQNLNQLREAWQKIETVVVNEPAWTPLAKHADIVLPTTVGLERNDLGASPRDSYLIASKKAADAHGEALDDYEIFSRLADRLSLPDKSDRGFEREFTDGRTAEEWLRVLYDESRTRGNARGFDLPEYEKFLEAGFLRLELPQTPVTLLEKFRQNPNSHPLKTPSGLIEIFSETIAGFGIEDNPGHPVWNEPSEWLGAKKTKSFPMHLISHQPERRLHSQLDDSAHSRAGKINGREPCRLNPQDARRQNISDGDYVKIFNDRGSLISVASIDPNIRPGVLMIATGAWYDPDWDGDDRCCKHGNPNVVTSDQPTSSLAQGPSAQTCLVAIKRFEGPVPEVTAFGPPKFDILSDEVLSQWKQAKC